MIPTNGDFLQPLLSLVRPKLLVDSFKNWNGAPLHEFLLQIPHSLLIVKHDLIKNVNSEFEL